MRILFTRFPLESAYGGAEVQTLSLMKELKQHGHAVSFLGSCPVLFNEIKKLLVTGYWLTIGAPPVTKWSAITFLFRQKRMKRLLIQRLENLKPVTSNQSFVNEKKGTRSEERINAIVMLSLSEKLLLTQYAVQQGINVIWVEHDRVGRWLTWNPWLFKLRSLSRHVTTVTVSELSRKLYIGLGWNPDTVVTIPNGIEPQCLRPGEGPRLTQTMLRIGCVARLSHDKGVDLLIDALIDHPRAQLAIVGTGRDEEVLRKKVLALGLENRVTFESGLENLGPFYQSVDLLVLPSRAHDPFGLVAAEAMMMGTAVLVTDACGIAGYVENGKDAVVVPATSTLALSEGILQLTDTDVRSRIAVAGKQTAQQKFTAKRMTEEYEKLLRMQ